VLGEKTVRLKEVDKMKARYFLLIGVSLLVAGGNGVSNGSQMPDDPSPRPTERQLPKSMHSAMEELPLITVGRDNAQLTGGDNRVLQAAVDYIAGLGGGTVAIGAGRYLMYDSLHLRTNVTVMGTAGKTILRKADGVVSLLALDGDFGEQQITVADSNGFAVGRGVAIWDDRSGGFHTTVARITGRSGNTFSIDKPLMADCMVRNNAKAGTVFPVVSGYHIERARIESVIIEGNKESNVHLNGCRGAGIFLYRGFGTIIQDCEVRGYNGDGISFQQSNDVTVLGCTSRGNAFLGIHPGSGSQRPSVRNCIARNNGTDGLFLCWRVRHGFFEYNTLEGNGRYGISIGHKDSDNTIFSNQIIANHMDGIYFRNETLPMAAHRNRLEQNVIENNGRDEEVAGICIRGETNDLVLKGNTIRDTREGDAQKQTVGIKIEEKVGRIAISGNNIQARRRIEDLRVPKLEPVAPRSKTD
jgi:parallel beta-helix repeat protein